MADRNIYNDEIDFAALALQSPAFNKFLKANGQLDFSDPKAVQELTKSLLQRDFGIQMELPDDRLCPPVPNRFNYMLWIQDLLDTTSDNYSEKHDADRDVVALDIGTGASCIYPLLGCSQRPKWRFAATGTTIQTPSKKKNPLKPSQNLDIDEKNLTYAKRNILSNNLKSRIRPLLTQPTDPLIPLDALSLSHIDVTLTNPPFYTSSADLLASASSKSRPPHSACTGAPIEMVTPGGEVAFVTRIIIESKTLKHRCQWFTSMLGKYSSVETIVEKLKAEGVDNWAVKDLVQGGRTRRWVVGWSWGDRRPDQKTARGTATLAKHLLPFPSEYGFLIRQGAEEVAERLQGVIAELDLRWQYRPAIRTGVGFARGNVWSRAARRKGGGGSGAGDGEEGEPALGFKVVLRQGPEGMEVVVRWLQGRDSVLFESFCGMVKRRMAE